MEKNQVNLSYLATPGRVIAIRVTPRAARMAVLPAAADEAADLRILVTSAPEGGKANRAVVALLARVLGVPKSRITLLRGERSRNKLVRIE